MADHFWVDTNVVIRHITGEPEHQSEIVRQIMQRVDDGTYILHIHPIVIAECCYVLEIVYGFEKSAIVQALQTFLTSKGIETAEKASVERGLTAYEQKNVDFEDAYLAAVAHSSSVTAVLTFDHKHFKRLEGEIYTPKDLVSQ